MKLEIAQDIVTWFDPKNIDHLKAYRYLTEHGMWPSGFVPENITFTTTWHVGVVAKMADCYLEEHLKEGIR